MSLLSDQALGVCLTPRELEVLALVAGGLSAKEIALHIAIAPRTVERHIDNARAIASGLLDAPVRDEKDVPLSAPFAGQAHGGMEAILLL